MGLDGLKWVSIWKKYMDFNGFRWIEMGFNMEKLWISMGLDGLKWVSIWKHMDFNGLRWIEMGFNGFC